MENDKQNTEKPSKAKPDNYILDAKGKSYVAVGGMIHLFGRYYRAMLDGGWGCDGCALSEVCGKKQAKKIYGSCDGDKRPDGNSVIFADCGINPFR